MVIFRILGSGCVKSESGVLLFRCLAWTPLLYNIVYRGRVLPVGLG